MDRKVRISNDILAQMEARKKLTPDGRNWLVQALDPFHDVDRKLAGYPDTDGSKTLVQCVNTTITITAPGSDPWDCHICSLPELVPGDVLPDPITGYVSSSNGNLDRSDGIYDNFQQPYKYGLITINSVPAGAPTWPTADGNEIAPPNNFITPTQQVLRYDAFLAGATRIIAMGFEVHNTTPDLFKSGSVVVYRMPQVVKDDNPLRQIESVNSVDPLNPNTQGYLNSQMKVSNMPPGLQGDALIYAGSRQWDAEEGCYVVCTMNTEENPLSVRTNEDRLFVNGPLTDLTSVVGDMAQPLFALQNVAGNFVSLGIPLATKHHVIQPVPWNTSGAYFAGLLSQSVLTLTVRVYFEMSPYSGSEQSQLLETMAMPSAPFDPVALELYSHISAHMPSGAKVAENAAGDFWRKVLSMIQTFAPAVGSAIAGPAGGAVGSLISAAAAGGQRIAQSAKITRNLALPAQVYIARGKSSLKSQQNVSVNDMIRSDAAIENFLKQDRSNKRKKGKRIANQPAQKALTAKQRKAIARMRAVQ